MKRFHILALFLASLNSFSADMTLAGYMKAGSDFAIFCEIQGVSVTYTKVGQELGGCKLVRANLLADEATFLIDGVEKRIVLRSSRTLDSSEAQNDSTGMIVLPSTYDFKNVLVSKEMAGERPSAERIRETIMTAVNLPMLSYEQRRKMYEDIISGKAKVIVVGPSGLSKNDQITNNLSDKQVEQVNKMNDIGTVFEEKRDPLK